MGRFRLYKINTSGAAIVYIIHWALVSIHQLLVISVVEEGNDVIPCNVDASIRLFSTFDLIIKVTVSVLVSMAESIRVV